VLRVLLEAELSHGTLNEHTLESWILRHTRLQVVLVIRHAPGISRNGTSLPSAKCTGQERQVLSHLPDKLFWVAAPTVDSSSTRVVIRWRRYMNLGGNHRALYACCHGGKRDL
jgi:hypothetical protein